MQERPCRSCGTRIAIVPTKDGKHIPLDLVAPVYELQSDGQLSRAERARGFYVSHYASCPQASMHSKKGSAPKASAAVAGGQGRGAEGVEGSAGIVFVSALGLLALVVLAAARAFA